MMKIMGIGLAILSLLFAVISFISVGRPGGGFEFPLFLCLLFSVVANLISQEEENE
jgi:uncharacterized integral membrane protein